ncbi:MAG: thiamine-binding protein, partial [Candidatus Krumholzibacteria bacterium]|nr:thiamine-binding protein [Candidatus Krumholzibacteria bacterium]
MVLLEFAMYPTDKGESVSNYVQRNLEIIDDSGLPYRLGPMGTCLEGEYDEV